VRLNTVLIGLVGAAVLGLLLAALSKDATRQSPLANATRPQLTPATVVITTSTSTTVQGDLVAAGMGTATDLFGLSSTTTSSIAVAATVPAPPRGAAPVTAATTATTTPRAPGTTVVNPDVVYSDVPTTPTTTAPATTTPVATTAPPLPPTTATPTTAPPATTTPTTASTGITLPLVPGLPPLLTP
jgi:hypothetical protein